MKSMISLCHLLQSASPGISASLSLVWRSKEVAPRWEGRQMPKAYTKMRDRFKSKGMSDKGAKTKAAKIYNSKRGSKRPVTGKKH